MGNNSIEYLIYNQLLYPLGVVCCIIRSLQVIVLKTAEFKKTGVNMLEDAGFMYWCFEYKYGFTGTGGERADSHP